MMNKSIIYASLAFTLAACDHAANIKNMRCEYLTSPIGIDVTSPRLTWEYADGETPDSCYVEISTDPRFATSQRVDCDTKWMCRADIEPEAGTKYYWRVVAPDGTGHTTVSPTATFETGKFSSTDWSAKWVTDAYDKDREEAPVFRHSFTIESMPKEAQAYVSAIGYYEMMINGKRVGDHHMDPGYTDYGKRSLYVTHDVTDLLKTGENVVTVTLGNGFANSQSGDVWGWQSASWRKRPQFICEITGDGNVLAATDKEWLTTFSPVTYNNIYSGEHRDGRIDPHLWNNAIETEAPNEILTAQSMPAILPTEEIKPTLLQSWGDTVHLYDLGKNIAGVCRLNVKGEAGTRIDIAHGELLKDNGRLEQGNINIYHHVVKPDEAFQTDVYVLSGAEAGESFQPQFTYHGFRYAEVRSDHPVKAEDIDLTGVMMHTDLKRVGNFSCSNDLLNRIYEATMLSYVDNIHSIPTDCPQREKNGWTADAHVAIDLALQNYDGITFYEKWMNDMADNQRENGNIAGIIPSAGWGYGTWPGPVWDAAMFIIPTALYDYYGDPTAMQQMYPSMERYMEWLESNKTEEGILTNGIGDWCPYNTQTPTDFTSSLYGYADYKMMSRISTILGKDASKWEQKAAEMKDLINSRWLNDSTGLYANGSQAAQAIALYWDVVPEDMQPIVAKNLNDMVVANNYALDFGLLGTKSVLRMLTKHGYADTAYKMATRTEAPSWGYWLDKCGYTTLAETWTLSPRFNDASLNHAFFGDISAWMVSDIAGLNFDKDNPGFCNVIIRPHFVEGLDHAEARYESVKGPISCGWERIGNGKIKLTVSIPAGTTATVDCEGLKRTLNSGKNVMTIE